MEVPLSHLTKVVYILFYNHPEGLYLSNLYEYKDEIKKLYLAISNQNNYDKMMSSVEDLVTPHSNAIYPHISRIKNTFYKLMCKYYADNYIIVSHSTSFDYKYINMLNPKKLKIGNPSSFDEELPF